MADDATHSRTCAGTQNAAAQDIAYNATNDGTGGSAFFLVRHAGTTTQAEDGREKNGGQGGKAFAWVHGYLQIG